MKTSFSRRELYALGEPLGESVTRQVAGRRVYGAGGGAGLARQVASTVGGLGSNVSQGAGQTTGATPFSQATNTPSAVPSVLPQAQTNTQAGVADYAQPYVNTMLGATMQQLFNYDAQGNATGLATKDPYSYNPADYFAGFSPLQQQAQQGIAALQAPSQTGQASQYANQAIQGLLGQQYNPQTNSYKNVGGAQFQGPASLQAQNVSAERVNAPQLQALNMQAAGNVGTQSFTQPGTASDYINPYMQNVVDIQKREAQRQSGVAGTQQQAQAAQAGAFGGSRDAIMRAERERNLATQMGDIQATGSQAAYSNAQQQFNAEQQARLQANLANQANQQQANLQNLSAGLQTQGLGAQTGLQAQQLNQATGLQSQLANQQAGLTAGQANQSMQYNTAAQNAQLAQQANLANQSAYQQAQNLAANQQQFGANLGLQGLQGALSGAGTLGNLGTSGLQNQLGVLNAQQATGATQQQQQQNIINQGVQNYQTAQQNPYTQLQFMQGMLQGLPINTSSSQQYQAAPSTVSQLAGLGIAGIGLGNLMGGTGGTGSTGGGITGTLNSLGNLLPSASTVSNYGSQAYDWAKNALGLAEGGHIKEQDNAGLANLAISKME